MEIVTLHYYCLTTHSHAKLAVAAAAASLLIAASTVTDIRLNCCNDRAFINKTCVCLLYNRLNMSKHSMG